MTKLAQLSLLLALLYLSLSASAQTLSGTVTNGTTNKPAAGDEVILINISNGMDIAANTKADSAGKFSFTLKDGPGAPHLIRAVHQGVTYHQMAPPGTSNVDVKVYNVAKQVNGLSLTADVLRIQADKGTLQGVRLFAVDNNSSPAVTQMNDHNFEFYLPAGAKVESAQAKAPNGQPIAAETAPQAEKNRYAIVFPLRPGETQFQVEFTLPYNGSVKIDPKPLYPAEHFVVVLPKSMQFSADAASLSKPMQDPGQADSVVHVAQQVQAGQKLAFTVSGTGTISEQPAQVASGAAQEQSQAGSDNRPGGGLGAPIDAPDPLEKYRWPIIGAFVVLLGIGGWIVTKRQTALSAASAGSASSTPAGSSSAASAARSASAKFSLGRASRSAPPAAPAAAPIAAATAQAAPSAVSKSAALLEVLKEEMFQLEVERKQGKISAAEYEKARAALDQTLERALKRQG